MSNHWKNISEMVTEIALPIIPHIRSSKLKSEIISNLFESQAEKYFNSIQIPVRACVSDREPDLLFLNTNKPLEIKVTKSDHPFTRNCKWTGGKLSKRNSDYILIVWNYVRPTILEPNTTIKYFITKSYIEENEWLPISDNYYGTEFNSKTLFNEKEYEIIMGQYSNNMIVMV